MFVTYLIMSSSFFQLVSPLFTSVIVEDLFSFDERKFLRDKEAGN